jgi:MFS family permease
MRKLIPFYLIIFAGYLGITMTIILFTTMIMNLDESILPKAVTITQRLVFLGILLSLYPLGQLMGIPIIGRLSDTFGHRYLLILTLSFSVLLYFLIGFFISRAWIMGAIPALFLLGISEGNVVIAQNKISDLTQDKSPKSKRFNLIWILLSISFLIGPFLVTHFERYDWSLKFNFSIPFYCIGSLLFFVWCHVAFVYKETKSNLNQNHIYPRFLAFKTIVNNQNIRSAYLANFFLYLSVAGVFRLYPILLVDSFNLSTYQLSRALALNGLAVMMANIFVVPKLKKIKAVKILTFCILTGAILYFILSIQKGLPTILILTFLVMLLMGVAMTSATLFVSEVATKESIGEVLSNNTACSLLSQIVIGFFGIYALFVSSKGPFLISGIFAVLSLLVYLKISRRNSVPQVD